MLLQQRLPFTVLKPFCSLLTFSLPQAVATALTVYGIETSKTACRPATPPNAVATALTVYGIETSC